LKVFPGRVFVCELLNAGDPMCMRGGIEQIRERARHGAVLELAATDDRAGATEGGGLDGALECVLPGL
jgi:hypothetical protein